MSIHILIQMVLDSCTYVFISDQGHMVSWCKIQKPAFLNDHPSLNPAHARRRNALLFLTWTSVHTYTRRHSFQEEISISIMIGHPIEVKHGAEDATQLNPRKSVPGSSTKGCRKSLDTLTTYVACHTWATEFHGYNANPWG